MRTLLKLALLAAALFTVACTEMPDDTQSEAADIDQPVIDRLDDSGDDTVNPRELAPGAVTPGDRMDDRTGERPPSQPGEPGTGVAECRTNVIPRAPDPVIGVASRDLGRAARARLARMHRANLVK